MKTPKGQLENSENEGVMGGDPNIVGHDATAAIQDRRAGPMTSCQEYDQNEPFYSSRVRKGAYNGQ